LQQRAEEGIIRSHLGGDYKRRDSLVLRENEENGNRYMWMNGRKVYVFAKAAVTKSCLRVLDPGGTASKEELRALFDQVKKIIPHQANARIIKGAAKDLEARLEVPEGSIEKKMIMTIEKYGNNSTASIPLALDESLRNGKLKKGDLVILVGFGAGLTYGANLVRI